MEIKGCGSTTRHTKQVSVLCTDLCKCEDAFYLIEVKWPGSDISPAFREDLNFV